ncbi:MAG: T9SS type A sorting domain-containing protein [Bacteroidales bacterium]|nr:T9SS type A sorting domain-containing protein [Bacteroidales bacterium]
MKQIVITILIFFIFNGLSLSQEIVSCGGGSYYQETMSLHFTLGEPVTETFTAENNKITQGFHQSFNFVSSVEKIEKCNSLIIFPNPADDIVYFNFGENFESNFTLNINDITGNVLLVKKIKTQGANSTTSLDISFLPPGLYFIEILATEKFYFKLIIQ